MNQLRVLSTNTVYQDRLPPQDIDTEESILSACLNDKESAIEIVDMITDGIFYRNAHQKIFAAMAEIIKTGTIDLLSTTEYLQKTKELEEVGGATYLAQIFDFPMSVNIEQDCNRLKEKHALREIIKISSNTIGKAFDLIDTPESLIDNIQKEINDISLLGKIEDNRIREIIHGVCNNIDYRIDNKKEITGVDTGFDGLNWYTGGLQPTDLIIIAARPSMGKTSIALNLLINASGKDTFIDFYSYEMGKDQLIMRLISMIGSVKYSSLRSGYMSKEAVGRYQDAAAKVSEMSASIHDNGDLKIGDFRRIARRNKKKYNTGMIIVDYLQLIPKEKQSTNDAVGEISRNLKMTAKELNVPVVALSQLNRKVEERGNKVPTLADLRDSGNIEQDADVVLFPFRPAVYIDKKFTDDGKTETPEYSKIKNDAFLYISKHRNGPIGCTKLFWDQEYSTFKNLIHSETAP